MTNTKNTTVKNYYRFFRRLGAGILSLALLFAVGCKRTEYTDTEQTTVGTVTRIRSKNDVSKKNSDVLNIGYFGTGTEKNPLKVKETAVVNLLNLSYDSMFVVGTGGQIENSLVENYKILDGGKYEFTLRQGVTFHDGSKLTAGDVVKTVATIKDGGDESEARNTIYANVKSLVKTTEAKDERTVIMEFNYGGISPLYSLMFPIVSSSGLGTGLYKINNFTDSEIDFSYYEQSWKQAPLIRTIKAKKYGNEDSMARDYKENKIDGAFTDHRNVGLYKYTKNTKTMNVRTNEFYYLMPNLSSGKLSDIKVRQALSYGIDKESVVSRTFDSNAIIADFPIPSDYFIFDNQLLTYSLDVGKCLRKFNDLGYSQKVEGPDTFLVKGEEKFSFKIIGLKEDNLYHKIIAQTVASQLSELGVAVNVELLNQKDYSNAVKNKNYDIAIANTIVGSDFDLRYLLSTGGGGNYNGINVSELNTALNNIVAAKGDLVKVKDEYTKIQEIMVKQIPIIGLCFVTDTFVYSDRLSNVTGANSNNNMLFAIHSWNFEGQTISQSELVAD